MGQESRADRTQHVWDSRVGYTGAADGAARMGQQAWGCKHGATHARRVQHVWGHHVRRYVRGVGRACAVYGAQGARGGTWEERAGATRGARMVHAYRRAFDHQAFDHQTTRRFDHHTYGARIQGKHTHACTCGAPCGRTCPRGGLAPYGAPGGASRNARWRGGGLVWVARVWRTGGCSPVWCTHAQVSTLCGGGRVPCHTRNYTPSPPHTAHRTPPSPLCTQHMGRVWEKGRRYVRNAGWRGGGLSGCRQGRGEGRWMGGGGGRLACVQARQRTQ